MQIALVSSCTNRKKLTASANLLGRNLVRAPLEAIAAKWVQGLSLAETRVPVRDLYAGRAFTEVMAVTGLTRGGAYIVSAGLGLVSIDDEVPAYGLTVAGSDEDSVLAKIAEEHATSGQWWEALTRAQAKIHPLRSLIEGASNHIFVLALPSSYIEMIAGELAKLPSAAAMRVRVIGLPSLSKFLPQQLSDSLIPYDERFEAAEVGRAGTRSDFPQRAARHFIEKILPQSQAGSAQLHAQLVAKELEGYSSPKIPRRDRYSDDMLRDVIRGIWSESEGRVTNGLRILRREKKIACEQSRFKRLFWEVAAERGK